ncbi:putative invertase inhibitor [Carex littledalei]|uniref:Putative invertase inhibitor n=1 Tax=Carex littledalei TaxID=544730 RepID=A0A833QSX3_9POAL|nr:putative invertase inhibitor [Carex littledalei]
MNPELSTCRSLYSSMIDNLSVVANALDSSQQGTARTYLSAALDKPDNCEGAFSEKQTTLVLSKENTNAKQLTAIALALLNM